MKKTICILLLCISMIIPFSVFAYAAEVEYSYSDYYDVVCEINEKYSVTITIESFADEITKTPDELYAELEEMVLRSKANEIKKDRFLNSEDTNKYSSAVTETRTTYFEELTKTSSNTPAFDVTVMSEYYWNSTQNKYYFCGGSDIEITTKTGFISNFFFFGDESGYKIWDGGRTLYAWATGDILYLANGFGWLNYYDVTESAEFGYNRLTVNN